MQQIEDLKKEIRKIMKNDPSHDFDHILRVFKNALILSRKEKADTKIVLAAALLHDIVHFTKSDKRSKTASIQSAKKAENILQKFQFTDEEIKIIGEAIRDHSFSRGKIPTTLEGKILQDADRLDALGAIGIARVFAVSGSEGRPFYDSEDPFCSIRKPDDKRWAIDHFYKKLLKLENLMNTKSAQAEAHKRTKILKNYLADFKKEI